jgi:hypothetical protein
MDDNMSFVVKPTIKFPIQFVLATIDTPRERIEFGKISCVITHATGPQEYAKLIAKNCIPPVLVV